jgi:aminomethyltransferase
LLLVVNAGTTDKDWEWISSHQHAGDNVELRNVSGVLPDRLQVRALSILQQLTETPLAEIKYYHFREGKLTASIRSSRAPVIPGRRF